MNIKEIRNLEWNILWDWSKVPKTPSFKLKKSFISKNDIHIYIIDVVKDLARKLDIEYSELYKLIQEENEAFYSTMENIFSKNGLLTESDPNFNMLCELFKIPSIPSSDPVKTLLNNFNKLNDFQKLEVLANLKLISVNVTTPAGNELPKNNLTPIL